MRVELVFPYSSHFNNTQNYVNCAHVEVKGKGGGKVRPLSHPMQLNTKLLNSTKIGYLGTPGPLVKFPGAYDHFDRCELIICF